MLKSMPGNLKGQLIAFFEFLRQILTHHILSIASAITLDINTSQISSIDSANSQVLLSLKAPWKLTVI